MSKFDTGAPLTFSESALRAASAVLQFPVFPLALSIFPQAVPFPLQYAPFLLNSLFWGTCLYFLTSWFMRRRKDRGREMYAA